VAEWSAPHSAVRVMVTEADPYSAVAARAAMEATTVGTMASPAATPRRHLRDRDRLRGRDHRLALREMKDARHRLQHRHFDSEIQVAS